jgi:hypothetical protein
MEKEAAEQYRLRQADKLLALFKEANGRPPVTVKELEEWLGSPSGKASTARHHNQEGQIIPEPIKSVLALRR